MSTTSISPEDPRLTAYVLGELEPDEREKLERELAARPEARRWLEEIRETTDSLGMSLRDEPMPESTVAAAQVLAEAPRSQRPAILRFPYLYFVVSGLAAACFAVFVTIRDRSMEKPAANNSVLAALQSRGAAASAPAMAAKAMRMTEETDAVRVTGEEFAPADTFFPVAEAATSTFPLHVGRESFDAVRAALLRGRRPPAASVRVAEMINAFSYSWPVSKPGEPFTSVLEESAAPWNPAHRLVRIGLRAAGEASVRVADDARVEVRFNAGRVAAWRLIGFEGGAPVLGMAGGGGEPMFGGASITVLYELLPIEGSLPGATGELVTVDLRYRMPESETVTTSEWQLPAGRRNFAEASADMKFAATVAAFGLGLRGTDPTMALAPSVLVTWSDPKTLSAERAEFLNLMRAAEAMAR